MSYDPTDALHCLRADPNVQCPIIKQRSLMTGQQAVDCEGRTPLERLKVMLDEKVDQLMTDPGKKRQEANIRGWISGLSFSIAVIENPYLIDNERVTEEAWQRWQEKNPEQDDE